MSETAASRVGGEALLAAAGLKNKAASPDNKKETDGSIDPTAAQDASEPLHDAASPESASPQTTSDETATKPAQPASEIELKLIVDADRLADFNNAPVMTANARSKGTRKHLRAA